MGPSHPIKFVHYIDKKSGSTVKPHNFSESALLEISMKAIHSWRDLSSASRNRKAACLKSFLSWCFEYEVINEPLAEKIPLPKTNRKLPHFLSVDESVALINSFKDDSDDKRRWFDLSLILLLYGCGLRVSEAGALQWKDIDLKRRQLKVQGKGAKERIVYFPEILITPLKNLRQSLGKTQYLFGESALDSRKAYQIVRDRGAQAGLTRPLHPHALRHSFATQMLTSGTNLRVLQKILGHDSLQTTQLYTHLDRDHLAQVLDTHHPLGSNKKKTSK